MEDRRSHNGKEEKERNGNVSEIWREKKRKRKKRRKLNQHLR